MRSGFYETEIMPPLGTTIFGYGRKRVNEGVKQKLYAKALVLESHGKKAALLVLDSVDIPPELPEAVIDRVSRETDIERDAILVAATHSHTSGPTRKNLGSFKDKPRLEGEPELNEELDAAYMEFTRIKATDAVILANQRLEESHVKFAMGDAKGVSFVREYCIKDGTIRTNPGCCKEDIVKPYSESESALPIFFFTDANGKPMGAVTSFSMHHDTVSGCEMSSDYSGVVAKNLKKAFGEAFITLFFAGFCGNTNHLNFMGEKQGEPFKRPTQEIGDILTREFLSAVTKAEPVKNEALVIKKEYITVPQRKLPEGLIDRVKELKKNPPGPGPVTIADPYSDRMLYGSAPYILRKYEAEKVEAYDVPVMVIKLGDCLIYSFVGEVFSQFADKIREQSPTNKNLMIELSNSDAVQDYIPIPELYDIPTVYEASIYSDSLVKEAGDMMVDKAIEMAKEIY